MSTSVLIDRCGLASALRGRRPSAMGDADEYTDFLLPVNEYRRYLAQQFSSMRISNDAQLLFDLVRGLAGTSQPLHLMFGAATHFKNPEVLYGISITIVGSTETESLDAVRIQAHWRDLSDDDAQLVAAAVGSGLDVLGCYQSEHGGEPRVVEVMKSLHVLVKALDHTCDLKGREHAE